MRSDFLRNARRAIAITLICIWAMGSLASIPVLDNANVLLGLAPFVQYTHAPWNQRIAWRFREGMFAMAVVATFVGVAVLLSKWIPAAEGRAFVHSPFFVLVTWAIFTCALVWQATQAARAAAIANPRPTPAGFPDRPLRDPGRLKQ